MSATNRGATRNKDDYYFTPQWSIAQFLNAFNKDFAWKTVARILDPCAGGDAVQPMAYPTALKSHPSFCNATIDTMDIRSDSPAGVCGDFITAEIGGSYDMIITNPPFSLSVEITRKALAVVKPGGYVVMLQRLNWFGAQSRLPFWRANLPVSTYVHNKRISFHGTKSTDSIEYAHFVFQRGNNPEFSKLKVL